LGYIVRPFLRERERERERETKRVKKKFYGEICKEKLWKRQIRR
jgi:hypothetical protein